MTSLIVIWKYGSGSAAEDNIVFPGVSKRANQTVSYASEHQEEELQFSTFQSLLNGFETSEDGCMTEVVSKLVDLADDIVESVQKHFSEEETMVRLIISNFGYLFLGFTNWKSRKWWFPGPSSCSATL